MAIKEQEIVGIHEKINQLEEKIDDKDEEIKNLRNLAIRDINQLQQEIQERMNKSDQLEKELMSCKLQKDKKIRTNRKNNRRKRWRNHRTEERYEVPWP